jgi:hypothetical protein
MMKNKRYQGTNDYYEIYWQVEYIYKKNISITTHVDEFFNFV